MHRTLAFLFVLSLARVAAQGQPPPAAPPSWPVDIRLEYSIVPNVTYSVANDYSCKLDVYAKNPRGTVAPTVVYIHGGGWVGGTKEGALWELLPYLDMGFHVINVEYRMARVSPAPAAVEDCRVALRWVYANAKQYGFDTTKIVVTGGSAGGHLALMTGMLDAAAGFDAPKEWDDALPSMKVAAIVNWFGITDVKELLDGPNRQSYAVNWLGSLADREKVAVRVSPLTYVRAGLPPVLTIHGDNDQLVPYTQAVRLHKALTSAGVPNRLMTIPGGRHGGFTRDQLLAAYATIREFLEQYGIRPAAR
ncbi:MAG TPA: alpha/beta hydrolase [Bacteroidota bacterium]|nr:alpha/beta hydrolase [Bacteroidota bacterium]